MKRFLSILCLLSCSASGHAVTSGPVAISSGSAYYNVDTSSMSNASVRQNIVIGDPNGVNQLAPVSSITGLTVNLATSTALAGTVQSDLVVSSNTSLPASTADLGVVGAMGDNKGRLVTMPLVPYGNILVATTTITTDTGERIFISSGGANTAVNLIGCIGENTSATATDIIFRPGLTVAAGSFALGMSASNVPVGFFPPGGIIQPKANLNSNWTVQSGGSVTSLKISCWFYLYVP